MSRPGRGWTALSLLGIALWIGVTVLVTVVNDDPSDGTPTLVAFAGGGAVFFGAIFGYGLWRTRPRSDPELDLLMDELAIEPRTSGGTAVEIDAMRRVARVYLALGAAITALGLLAILEQGLGFGSVGATIGVIIAITSRGRWRSRSSSGAPGTPRSRCSHRSASNSTARRSRASATGAGSRCDSRVASR